MPNGKRGKRNQRRKRRVRGRQPGDFGNKGGMPQCALPGPPAQRRFLSYSDVKTLTESVAGVGAYYQYRLNSIYDPDFTSTGTSSLGYSQWMAMYSRHRVVKVRVMLNWALSTSGPVQVGVLFGMSTTPTSTMTRWPVEPNSHSMLLNGTTGSRSGWKLDKIVPLSKVAGVTQRQFMTDMDFAGVVGANPSAGIYMTIFLIGYAATASIASCEVKLIQDVEFSSPTQTLTP